MIWVGSIDRIDAGGKIRDRYLRLKLKLCYLKLCYTVTYFIQSWNQFFDVFVLTASSEFTRLTYSSRASTSGLRQRQLSWPPKSSFPPYSSGICDMWTCSWRPCNVSERLKMRTFFCVFGCTMGRTIFQMNENHAGAFTT